MVRLRPKGEFDLKTTKGERGIQGPPGPAGPRGLQGLTGKTGKAGIPGAIGKVTNLTEVGTQLKVVDKSIEHIYKEMDSHITQLSHLHQQLDSLREIVRNLANKTEAFGMSNSKS